ncbi:glutathione S-transferase family protein [Amaricoccus solimangrovi]|uniref:Glutathione S-transferase family protein n=1 Tax=Amaricoccus solimangrovi TaxID=2589815 RepID=A0A501WH89_9RHOB|nr:glutathione S-transferase family protein [Amaricoccus solimangrovi]TPE48162.1 glutathione S-transferase family protein [Amaricoccus solimangrovi]
MPEHGRITLTALKWVPPFAAGQVRDHRVRWMLNEIGWDYEVELIDPATQASGAYLAEQPFGQVPVLRETGRPALFETGAIVLDLAERSGRLWPADRDARALVRSWVIAALNSVEPWLSAVAEVDFFTRDETLRDLRRPGAVAAARARLGKLSAALGDRPCLVADEFTAADLMMASVLRVAGHADLLGAHPNLSAYRERCLARPAFRKAVADQCRDIAAHGPEDMGWDPAIFAGTATR